MVSRFFYALVANNLLIKGDDYFFIFFFTWSIVFVWCISRSLLKFLSLIARMDVKDHNSIETEEDTEDIMELELEEVVDEDEDEELDSEQLQLPRPTSWTDPETGKTVHGMEVFALKYEFDDRPKNTAGRRDEFGVCPVCYLVLTSNGTHQIWYRSSLSYTPIT